MIPDFVAERKIIAALAFIAAVFTIGGFIHTAGFTAWVVQPSSDDPVASSATLAEPFPAFIMTHTVTTASGTDTYRLDYTNNATWKHTLIGSTANPSRVGYYKELRNGVVTTFIHGEYITSEAGVGYHVPGPWLTTQQWLSGRAAAGAGTMATQTVGNTATLTLSSGGDSTQFKFDTATGIPVGYTATDGGSVVERIEVTSLTSGGTRIR